MGCKNACICGGMCVGCSDYEKENYFGEAEDIYYELHKYKKEEEEYYKAMEEQYYRDMEEQYYRDMEEQERLNELQNQNYDFERGDVKY